MYLQLLNTIKQVQLAVFVLDNDVQKMNAKIDTLQNQQTTDLDNEVQKMNAKINILQNQQTTDHQISE